MDNQPGHPPRRAVILIDLFIKGCLGLGFALCARDRIRADGPFASPAFPLVAVFIGVVATPITLYLYLVHPAWSWMYAIDPARVPHLAIVPVLAVHGGMVVVGWFVGARLLRLRRDRAALYTLAGAALVTLVLVLVAHTRLSSYGTYEEFHHGLALDLWKAKLGYVLVALALGLASAAGYVALELARDSRRVRTR